jgi:hypothetical protein
VVLRGMQNVRNFFVLESNEVVLDSIVRNNLEDKYDPDVFHMNYIHKRQSAKELV